MGDPGRTIKDSCVHEIIKVKSVQPLLFCFYKKITKMNRFNRLRLSHPEWIRMSIIHKIAGPEHARIHVVLFHGLGGHFRSTWEGSSPDSFWPDWLAADTGDVAVWSIEYSAPVFGLAGNAMYVSDMATNILMNILAHPELKMGELVLIGHSLGGIVLKSLLRIAQSLSRERSDAEDLIGRVKRVVFLATPHFGSEMAKLGDGFRARFLKSKATAALVRHDPALLELNAWYLEFSRGQKIEHLVFKEMLRTGGIWKIVNPNSSDPGVGVRPWPIVADHIGICKPENRRAGPYPAILEFVKKPLSSNAISTRGVVIPQQYIDGEIDKKLWAIRKARLFLGFDLKSEVEQFAEKVIYGEWSGGSSVARSQALAWCSRFAISLKLDQAEQYLVEAKKLGSSDLTIISEAFFLWKKDFPRSLNLIRNLNSQMANSAKVFIVKNHFDNIGQVEEWMENSGVGVEDIDGDAKYLLIQNFLLQENWDKALFYAQKITESDFEFAPANYWVAGTAILMPAVPEAFRKILLQTPIPFDAARFELSSDSNALQRRRQVISHYRKGASIARSLGCIEVAEVLEDSVLWLKLRDPALKAEGMTELVDSIRAVNLRRIQLGWQFGLKLDVPTVQEEIDREFSLSGGKSRVAASARFYLMFLQDGPEALREYVSRYRDQMEQVVEKENISTFEIQLLCQARSVIEAEVRLEELVQLGLDEKEVVRLRAIISEYSSNDIVAAHKDKYDKSKDIFDLGILVRDLEEKKDWVNICHYGKILFDETKSLPNLERLIKALNECKRFEEVAELFKAYPEFIAQSEFLKMAWAWSFYYECNYFASSNVLAELDHLKDTTNYRALSINLAVSLGDWESLASHVESEWLHRENRTARELLKMAQMGLFTDSQRAKDLLKAAVDKAPEDPSILAEAYFIAMRADWESDPDSVKWLHKAAALSGPNGPLRRMTLHELVDRIGGVSDQQAQLSQKLYDGEIPLFAFGHIKNKSLSELFLLAAISNRSESDVRRRVLIPAYNGAQAPRVSTYKNVVLDVTCLMTLSLLDLLTRVSEPFNRIFIPSTTLPWLFNEKQKNVVNQPSKLKEAREILNFVASGIIKVFAATPVVDADLSSEIGKSLASFILDAGVTSVDGRPKMVVKGAPVYRLRSLMQEEANLSPYYGRICGCKTIISWLRQNGFLSISDESTALAYLGMNEVEWPEEGTVVRGSRLYLDDISVLYLQHLGVLEALGREFEVFISADHFQEVKSLAKYGEFVGKINGHIDAIRDFLRREMASGKVTVVPGLKSGGLSGNGIEGHPTFDIYALAKDAEAVFVDDRALNRYSEVGDEIAKKPIYSTLELLGFLKSTSMISESEYLGCMYRLRSFGYLCVPLDLEELNGLVSSATISNGKLSEVAELKAIRENLLMVQMDRFLRLPDERVWLINVMTVILVVLKNQWAVGIEVSVSKAKSEWLLQFLNLRGWAHCFRNDNTRTGESEYVGQLLGLLFGPTAVHDSIRQQYFAWVEERVWRKIKTHEPEIYGALLDRGVGSFLEALRDEQVYDDGNDAGILPAGEES